MITKKELLAMCLNLFDETDDLKDRIDELEKEIKKMKLCKCGKKYSSVNTMPPRDKNGKFIKKK